jgi:hypothetical protein
MIWGIPKSKGGIMIRKPVRLILCTILLIAILAACSGSKDTSFIQPTTQLPEQLTSLPNTSPPSPTSTRNPVVIPKPGPFWASISLENQEGNASLTFRVSEDSTSISQMSLMLMGLQCGEFSSGLTILQATSTLPIQAGKFKGTTSSIGEIEGEFTSPTSARGQVHLLLDFGLGGEPIECGMSEFDAMLMPEKTETAPGERPTTPSESTNPRPGYAGKTFTGPLDGGSITFTVSADGLAIESGAKVILKDVGCTEGGGYLRSGEMTFSQSIPIQENQFHDGSLEINLFKSSSGIELIGQFDSDSSASGTFGWNQGDSLNPCILGPFEWTATTAAPTEPTVSAPTNPPLLLTPIELPGGDVAVVNVYSTEDGNDLYILGEVENRTSRYIANVNLNAIIYDANGKQTAAGDDFAKHSQIAPGERGPFIITIPKPASYASFSLKVDYDMHGSSPSPELRIVDQVIERDTYGMLNVYGMVNNGTTENLQYVMVVGVFYDSEGRVIGVGSNFAIGPDEVLISGKRAPFQFNPEPFNMGEYADYRLIMTNNGFPVDSAPPMFEINSVETGSGFLQGDVTFPGPGSANLPILWVATFDNQGKLIEVAQSYIEPDTLDAGKTGTFRIELLHPEYVTYELYSEYFIE